MIDNKNYTKYYWPLASLVIYGGNIIRQYNLLFIKSNTVIFDAHVISRYPETLKHAKPLYIKNLKNKPFPYQKETQTKRTQIIEITKEIASNAIIRSYSPIKGSQTWKQLIVSIKGQNY